MTLEEEGRAKALLLKYRENHITSLSLSLYELLWAVHLVDSVGLCRSCERACALNERGG